MNVPLRALDALLLMPLICQSPEREPNETASNDLISIAKSQTGRGGFAKTASDLLFIFVRYLAVFSRTESSPCPLCLPAASSGRAVVNSPSYKALETRPM
jgi:hypothetical protein